MFQRLAARLQVYPDVVRRRLVGETVRGWEIPSPRLGAVLRDDRLAVESYLLHNARGVLRIVFALNRRWEPPRWKWVEHYASELDVAPPELSARLVDALLEPNAPAAVGAMYGLVAETLELAAAEFDVHAARRATQARLAALAGSR